jgi:hypothetical protein
MGMCVDKKVIGDAWLKARVSSSAKSTVLNLKEQSEVSRGLYLA